MGHSFLSGSSGGGNTSNDIAFENFGIPVNPDTTRLLNNHAADGSTVSSFSAQPDIARTLNISLDFSYTGTMTITGVDVAGTVISEVVTFAAADSKVTTNAFKTVTSARMPNAPGQFASLGIDSGLGLSNKIATQGILIALYNSKNILFQGAGGLTAATNIVSQTDATSLSKNWINWSSAIDGSTLAAYYFEYQG